MNEIKFRAWDIHYKQMIYFDFNNIYGYEGEVAGVMLPDETTPLSYNSGYEKQGINKNLIIMRYTGLKTNGVDIYEGDIVAFKDYLTRNPTTAGVVEFKDASFLINSGSIKHYRWMDYEVNILGNVYENPELLGDE